MLSYKSKLKKEKKELCFYGKRRKKTGTNEGSL